MNDPSLEELITEAKSIQQLLVNYQETQAALQNDVNGFVERDLQEDVKCRELYRTVATAELELCQNTEFLRFEHKKDKSDSVIPTRRMQETAPLLNAAANVAPLTVSKVVNASSAPHQFAPFASVRLRDFGDFAEGLLGWRIKDPRFSLEASNLSEGLFANASNDSRYICCYNGIPFVPRHICGPDELPFSLDTLRNALKTELEGVPLGFKAAVAHQTYHNFIINKSTQSKKDFFSALLISPQMVEKNEDRSLNCLTGDAFDTVTLVEEDKLANAQLWRGFFFAGNLRVVEHLGPEVDIRSLQATGDNASLATVDKAELNVEEEQRLQSAFKNIFADLEKDPRINSLDLDNRTLSEKNFSFVIGVKRAGLNEPHSCVLLDCRPISPALPFYWHLTWEELCAVGQQKGDATSTVLIKCTKVSVLELYPSDKVSGLYLPLVNKMIQT